MFRISTDKTAVIAADKSLTYANLQESGEFVAKIKSRSFVFFLADNTLGSLVGYTAFLNRGIVPVMMDCSVNKDLLDNLVKQYDPNYIFTPKDISIDCGKTVAEIFDYLLIERHTNNLKIQSDLALLLTTSGSTGSPKFVRQSYKNIESNARAIIEYLEITESDRPITTLPMSYTYGLSIINSHLLAGATVLMTKHNFFQREIGRAHV